MLRTLLLALPIAVLATGAAAHSDEEATVPANGATVAEVPMLHMRFDAPMRIVAATLTTMDGAEVAIERGTGMEPSAEFHAVPAAPLVPGPYRFDWRGMAADGHPMQGGFDFTVAE